MKKLILSIVISLAALCATTTLAQTTKVGIKIIPEITVKASDAWYSDNVEYKFNYFSVSTGAQFVQTFTKLIGVETGVYLHRQKFSEDDRESSFTFLQVPACLRLEVKKTYISVGTSVNLQLTTKRQYASGAPATPDKDDGKVGLGVMIAFGKDWMITDKLGVITEVRFNGVPGLGAGMNVGFGFGANYALRGGD
jgi:hypothetical protein